MAVPVATSQVGLFLSASVFLALCVDEPALFRMFGLGGGGPPEKFADLSQEKLVRWPTVTAMWSTSQLALLALIQCAVTQTHAGAREWAFCAFATVTLLTVVFAAHASKSLTCIVLLYIGAISSATMWFDASLWPLVAATDVTAVVPILGTLLMPVAVADDSGSGAGSRKPAVAAAVAAAAAAVVATPASDAKLAKGRAQAIAGASYYSPTKVAALLLCLSFATALELSSPGVRMLQPLWVQLVQVGEPYVRNWLLPVSVATVTFVLACAYFSYLDLARSTETKLQPEWWPSPADMWRAAGPQLAVYALGQVQIWGLWCVWPEHYSYASLPSQAPTCVGLLAELSFCLVVGDLLIYWEHRLMHSVPYLRTRIHSVHHEYTAVFSWAGGWVHPLEDLVAVACQATPVLLLRPHPLTQWVFAALWVICLVDEHSGHDVWWSPYQLLPCTGCPQGGGAAPHDIHHYKPTKNFGFIFVTWDRLFGTFEAVSESHPCNPFVPPFNRERKGCDEKAR